MFKVNIDTKKFSKYSKLFLRWKWTGKGAVVKVGDWRRAFSAGDIYSNDISPTAN